MLANMRLYAVGIRSNVLLCRAIARIGEVPQAEGFGKKQRCSFANLQKSRFAADGRTPSARSLATSPISR